MNAIGERTVNLSLMTAKVLETCIKVVNLLAPYARGGKIGLFGSAGVMPPQGLASSVPTPTQYFLAIFTFFSFFNSPFSSYSHATPTGPTHSGIVLTDSGIFITPPVSHFWLRRLGFPRTLSLSLSPNFPCTDAARRAALINALDSMQCGTSNEAACLLTALGVHRGILGLLLSLATPTHGEKAKTLEHRQLKQ
ncbi:hypothetical protein V8E52_007988, partial [Russula decolorans]